MCASLVLIRCILLYLPIYPAHTTTDGRRKYRKKHKSTEELNFTAGEGHKNRLSRAAWQLYFQEFSQAAIKTPVSVPSVEIFFWRERLFSTSKGGRRAGGNDSRQEERRSETPVRHLGLTKWAPERKTWICLLFKAESGGKYVSHNHTQTLWGFFVPL